MASRTLELILALKTQNLESASQLAEVLKKAEAGAKAFGQANEEAGQKVSSSATKSATAIAQNEAAITKLTSTFKGSQQAATTLASAFDGNAVQAQKVYQSYVQLTKAGADQATINERLKVQFGASATQVGVAAKAYSDYGQTTQKAALNVLTLTDKIAAVTGTASAAQAGLGGLISATKTFTGQSADIRGFQLEFNRLTGAVASAVTTAISLQPAIQGVQQGFNAFKGAVDTVVKIAEAQKLAKAATEGTTAATTGLTAIQGALATAAGVANSALLAQAAAGALIIGAVASVAAVFDSLSRGTAATKETYEGLDRIRDIQVRVKTATGQFTSSIEGQDAVLKNISKTQGILANSLDVVRNAFGLTTQAEATYQNQLEAARINTESYSKINLEFARVQDDVNKGRAVSKVEIEGLGEQLKEQLVLIQKTTTSSKAEAEEKERLIAKIEGQISVTRQLERSILKSGDAAKFSEKQFKEFLGQKEAELAKVTGAVENSATKEKAIVAELVRTNINTVAEGSEKSLQIEINANAKKLAAVLAAEADLKAAITNKTTNADDSETLQKLAAFEKQKTELRVNGERLAGERVLLVRKNGLDAIQQELKRGEISEAQAVDRTLAYRLQKNDEDRVNVINLFASKKITEEQYNNAIKNLSDQRLGIIQEESTKRVAIAQKALADENASAATAIRQAEVDNQAAVLDLKTKGYANEGQLRAAALKEAQDKATAELAIEQNKLTQLQALFAANPTSDPTEQTKRTQELGDLQVSIGEKTNALGAVRLQQLTETYKVAIDELGVREQILGNISKLLDSQNAVTQASLAYQKAELDSALSTQNIRVEGLKEALTIQQSLLTEEEKKAQTEQDAANKAQIDQNLRILGQERLNQLGIEDGASRGAIAIRLAQAEQEQLALKARAFEANQIAEQAALQIAQQKRLIEIESLNLTAQKIQLEAEASGNLDLVARAKQLVNLTQGQISNLGKINEFEAATLKLKQDSERAAFTENQYQADYVIRQGMVKLGLQDIGAAGRIAAQDISGIPTQIGSAKDAADLLNKRVAETVEEFVATRKASTETFSGITLDVIATTKAIGDSFAAAFTGVKAKFGELPGLFKGAFEGLKTTATEAGVVTQALGFSTDNLKIGFTNAGSAAVTGFGQATDSAKAVIGATNEIAGSIDKNTEAFGRTGKAATDVADNYKKTTDDVVGYIDLVIEKADGTTFAFKQIPQGFDEAAAGIGQTLEGLQEKFKGTTTGIEVEFADAANSANTSIQGISFDTVDQSAIATSANVVANLTQSGLTGGENFQSGVIAGFDGIKPAVVEIGGSIESELAIVADAVGFDFKEVFDDIAKQTAATEKAAAAAAQRAKANQVSGNGFKGDPANDPRGGNGSFGGSIADYLRDAARPSEGNSPGVVFKDKDGGIVSPAQAAKDAIASLGGTAESVGKITGVVGDLAYQASVIASRIEANYRDAGITNIPNLTGVDFQNLISPRAKGGSVVPKLYQVNEAGQESYTNFKTGKTSLIPGGRQITTFPSPGYVNNANDTRKLKSSGLIDGDRLVGGNVGSGSSIKINNPAFQELLDKIESDRTKIGSDARPGISISNTDYNKNTALTSVYTVLSKAIAQIDGIVSNGGGQQEIEKSLGAVDDYIKQSRQFLGFASGADELVEMLRAAIPRAIPGRATGGFVGGATGGNSDPFSGINTEAIKSKETFSELNPEIKKSTEVFTEQTAIAKKKNEEDAIAQKRQAELSTGIKETVSSVDSFGNSLSSASGAAQSTSSTIFRLSDGFNNLGATANNIGSGLNNLSSTTANASSGLSSLNNSAGGVSSGFGSLSSATGSASSGLTNFDGAINGSGARLDAFGNQLQTAGDLLTSFSGRLSSDLSSGTSNKSSSGGEVNTPNKGKGSFSGNQNNDLLDPSNLILTKSQDGRFETDQFGNVYVNGIGRLDGSPSSGSGRTKKSLPAFATGGDFNIDPTKAFIAGERGAEVVQLNGRGGARIYNNRDSANILQRFEAGGTFNYGKGGSTVEPLANANIGLPNTQRSLPNPVAPTNQASAQALDNTKVVERLDTLIKAAKATPQPVPTAEISGDINFINRTEPPENLLLGLLRTNLSSI